MDSKRHIRPQTDSSGLPSHGAASDEGYVIRAHSKGPGVEVEVRNPLGRPPRRIANGAADFRVRGGRLFVTPSATPEGDEFALTVEY